MSTSLSSIQLQVLKPEFGVGEWVCGRSLKLNGVGGEFCLDRRLV
jgi:hypothetical protein